MKNIIKKISATAMAFTLLGAGAAITKTVSPNSVKTLTASAAVDVSVHGPIVRTFITSNKSGSYIYVYRHYVHNDGYSWKKLISQYHA